jgi:hypothetical protein
MSLPLENKYRLRDGKAVLGYLRRIDGRSQFYSQDGFWWSGRPIEYKDIDEWTGFYDKNRKPIYEWDIVYFKIDPDAEDCTGVVLWETNKKRFVIRKVDEEVYFPFVLNGIELFNSRQIKVFSYLFLNPELKAHLGLEDE